MRFLSVRSAAFVAGCLLLLVSLVRAEVPVVHLVTLAGQEGTKQVLLFGVLAEKAGGEVEGVLQFAMVDAATGQKFGPAPLDFEAKDYGSLKRIGDAASGFPAGLLTMYTTSKKLGFVGMHLFFNSDSYSVATRGKFILEFLSRAPRAAKIVAREIELKSVSGEVAAEILQDVSKCCSVKERSDDHLATLVRVLLRPRPSCETVVR